MKLVHGRKHRSQNRIALASGIALTFFCLSVFVCGQELPVVTQQQSQVAGKLLKYTAEVGRMAICDVETGEPHGYMGYTAYRVPSSSAPRPVTFVWNGGPGADS